MDIKVEPKKSAEFGAFLIWRPGPCPYCGKLPAWYLQQAGDRQYRLYLHCQNKECMFHVELYDSKDGEDGVPLFVADHGCTMEAFVDRVNHVTNKWNSVSPCPQIPKGASRE